MDDSRWQTIKPDHVTFLIRRICSDTEFKILLSDYVRLWAIESTASDLHSICKKENPLCEFEHSKVIKNIFNLFNKNLHSLKVGEVKNKSRTLKMFANLGHMPFNLEWSLSEQSPDALFKEVTYPLLRTAQDLASRQNYLCTLLKEKDMEIFEHKLENGPLKWGRIKTERFEEEEFKKQKFLYLSVNGADPIDFTFNDDLLCILNSKIDHDQHDVKTHQNNVKTEAQGTADNGAGSTSGEGNLLDSPNLKVKTEDSENPLKDAVDVKPKTENLELKDTEKSSSTSEGKSKRRKKVKLNI